MQDQNREIRTTRIIKAPIEKVWQAWTEPEHVTHWWGPAGFSSTIHKMDVSEGGEWELTLHSPDGVNFPNKSVYEEIVPMKKLVFEHLYPHFMTTVIFKPRGNDTHIEWAMQFDTPELRDEIVKAHKADQGQQENLNKLEKYLGN